MNATEVGGKERKTSKFRDIETSIQSIMRNKHDKFHNVFTTFTHKIGLSWFINCHHVVINYYWNE